MSYIPKRAITVTIHAWADADGYPVIHGEGGAETLKHTPSGVIYALFGTHRLKPPPDSVVLAAEADRHEPGRVQRALRRASEVLAEREEPTTADPEETR